MTSEILKLIGLGILGCIIAALIILAWKGLAYIKTNWFMLLIPVATVIAISFVTSSKYFVEAVMLAGGFVLPFVIVNLKK